MSRRSGSKGPRKSPCDLAAPYIIEGEVSDPDHDVVKVTWWQDNAAGTYSGDVRFSDQAALRTTLRVPDDAHPGDTVHVILEGTDNGTPALTRYQRLIVRVQ